MISGERVGFTSIYDLFRSTPNCSASLLPAAGFVRKPAIQIGEEGQFTTHFPLSSSLLTS